MILDFQSEADENFTLLGYLTANSGNWAQEASTVIKENDLKYHYLLRNSPEEAVLIYFAAEAWYHA